MNCKACGLDHQAVGLQPGDNCRRVIALSDAPGRATRHDLSVVDTAAPPESSAGVVFEAGVNKLVHGVNRPNMVLTVPITGVNRVEAGVNRSSDRHQAGYMRNYMAQRRAKPVAQRSA